jgi:hypothetical protein
LLPQTSPENKLYNQYVKDANKRGIDFLLKKSVFIALTKLPCHYCGQLPSNEVEFRGTKVLWNGLDRVDSSKEYSRDNVLPCCTNCNRAKHYLTKEEFLSLIKRVYVYNFGPQQNSVNSVKAQASAIPSQAIA